MENIISYIVELFRSFEALKCGKELIVFIISLMPILENRGGLIAARILEMEPIIGCVVSFIGNILPVPFILWFIKKIIDWMRNSRVKFFNKFVNWLDKKVDKKKTQIEKYGFLGLVLFVGIPLPGTGAWTGCLIAAMLNMDKKKSFIAAAIGVLMAGIIISLLSIGIFDGIFG
jgi:uncharacterized membrane protein